jgi:hypothetical protein
MRSLKIILLLIVCVIPATLAAQSQLSAGPSNSKWKSRLESLRPTEPLMYFELAEEVADAAADEADRQLARHLFALAAALDPDGFGRSSCLALYDLEPDELAKRRLMALASLLGHGAIGQPGLLQTRVSSDETSSAAHAASEALAYYRKGKGSQALSSLKRAGGQQLLEKYQRFVPGGLARLLEDCKHYNGQIKPTLSHSEITRMLRLEAALLEGAERSWESELMLHQGKPLIEVDPMRLEESLGVDAAKPLYRNGRWSEK